MYSTPANHLSVHDGLRGQATLLATSLYKQLERGEPLVYSVGVLLPQGVEGDNLYSRQ